MCPCITQMLESVSVCVCVCVCVCACIGLCSPVRAHLFALVSVKVYICV